MAADTAEGEHWLLYAAEAGVVLGGRVDLTPGLRESSAHFAAPVLSLEQHLELPALGYAATEHALGLRLLCTAIRRGLRSGARRVELLNLDALGAGFRASFESEPGRTPGKVEITVDVQPHRSERDWGSRLTVVHGRPSWARRRAERALLEGHCRGDEVVAPCGFAARCVGGLSGRLGDSHVSWETQHGDAHRLELGYEPSAEGSVALLYANEVLLELVELRGPRGTAVLVDRPWTRALHGDEPLRRVVRGPELEAWLDWARAWARRSVAGLSPRAR